MAIRKMISTRVNALDKMPDSSEKATMSVEVMKEAKGQFPNLTSGRIFLSYYNEMVDVELGKRFGTSEERALESLSKAKRKAYEAEKEKGE